MEIPVRRGHTDMTKISRKGENMPTDIVPITGYGLLERSDCEAMPQVCGKACKDDPLGGKSASSLTHLVWLQKLLFVVQRWKGKRG